MHFPGPDQPPGISRYIRQAGRTTQHWDRSAPRPELTGKHALIIAFRPGQYRRTISYRKEQQK
jgi:hypothetical protein